MKLSILVLACLSKLAAAQTCPDEGVTGFAAAEGGTTGGGDAEPTTVTTSDELAAAAGDSVPRVIVISGTIDLGGAIDVASDKSIIGEDASATIIGGLSMDGVSNIIIRNLNIEAGQSADAIASRGSDHIWYDHLSLYDAGDGLLDITKASDYQTVSWTKFWYSDSGAEHRFASLVGSGGGSEPDDEGKLHVTYHHNWWADNVDQRMPRVMYGEGHIYNNYYNSPGNLYCIGFGSYGSVLVQNNYFEGVNSPHEFMYNVFANADADGNVYDGTSGSEDTGVLGSDHVEGQEDFTYDSVEPPYEFTLDSADDVPNLVASCAGPR